MKLLHDALAPQQRPNRVGGDRSIVQPLEGFFLVDLHLFGRVFPQWLIRAQLIDKTTVTLPARVGHDHTIEWRMPPSMAGQSKFDAQIFSPPSLLVFLVSGYAATGFRVPSYFSVFADVWVCS